MKKILFVFTSSLLSFSAYGADGSDPSKPGQSAASDSLSFVKSAHSRSIATHGGMERVLITPTTLGATSPRITPEPLALLAPGDGSNSSDSPDGSDPESKKEFQRRLSIFQNPSTSSQGAASDSSSPVLSRGRSKSIAAKAAPFEGIPIMSVTSPRIIPDSSTPRRSSTPTSSALLPSGYSAGGAEHSSMGVTALRDKLHSDLKLRSGSSSDEGDRISPEHYTSSPISLRGAINPDAEEKAESPDGEKSRKSSGSSEEKVTFSEGLTDKPLRDIAEDHPGMPLFADLVNLQMLGGIDLGKVNERMKIFLPIKLQSGGSDISIDILNLGICLYYQIQHSEIHTQSDAAFNGLMAVLNQRDELSIIDKLFRRPKVKKLKGLSVSLIEEHAVAEGKLHAGGTHNKERLEVMIAERIREILKLLSPYGLTEELLKNLPPKKPESNEEKAKSSTPIDVAADMDDVPQLQELVDAQIQPHTLNLEKIYAREAALRIRGKINEEQASVGIINIQRLKALLIKQTAEFDYSEQEKLEKQLTDLTQKKEEMEKEVDVKGKTKKGKKSKKDPAILIIEEQIKEVQIAILRKGSKNPKIIQQSIDEAEDLVLGILGYYGLTPESLKNLPPFSGPVPQTSDEVVSVETVDGEDKPRPRSQSDSPTLKDKDASRTLKRTVSLPSILQQESKATPKTDSGESTLLPAPTFLAAPLLSPQLSSTERSDSSRGAAAAPAIDEHWVSRAEELFRDLQKQALKKRKNITRQEAEDEIIKVLNITKKQAQFILGNILEFFSYEDQESIEGPSSVTALGGAVPPLSPPLAPSLSAASSLVSPRLSSTERSDASRGAGIPSDQTEGHEAYDPDDRDVRTYLMMKKDMRMVSVKADILAYQEKNKKNPIKAQAEKIIKKYLLPNEDFGTFMADFISRNPDLESCFKDESKDQKKEKKEKKDRKE